MMNIDSRSAFEIINQDLKDEKLAIFCGAGISNYSGLPMVSRIVPVLLEGLELELVDIKKIYDNGDENRPLKLPFEAIVEILFENSNIDPVLDIYALGEPNTNHVFIAKLAKAHLVKTIVTTNFDLLIEIAMINEGLKESKDFQVYNLEDHFSNTYKSSWDNLVSDKHDIVRVFKIHGGIEDKNSIRATLKTVANQSLSEKRMSIINHLFSAGNHDTVLILGYSCSDVFDITPNIEQLNGNKKRVIYVKHTGKECEIENELVDKKDDYLFKDFPGKKMVGNTDSIIKHLWDSNEKTIGGYVELRSSIKWELFVKTWISDIKKEGGQSHFINGNLLFQVSDFNKAIKYYEKSLKIVKDIGNKSRESICRMNIGNAYDSLGDYNKAIEYHEESLKIAKDIGNKQIELQCYGNLANAYFSLYDFDKALDYYEKSLEITKDIGDKLGNATCYMNLGITNHSIGDFNKSIEYLEKSLKKAKDIGSKQIESQCYMNLGIANHSLGDFRETIEYFEKSLKIAKDIGNKQIESQCYMNLGIANHSLGDFNKAIEYLEKSLKIAKDIGNKQIESQCYMNLDNAYFSLGDNSPK